MNSLSLKLYLKEEESEADQIFRFEHKVFNCQDFMKRVEIWIEEMKLHKDLVTTSLKDITPMDSVLNVAAKQNLASLPVVVAKQGYMHLVTSIEGGQ